MCVCVCVSVREHMCTHVNVCVRIALYKKVLIWLCYFCDEDLYVSVCMFECACMHVSAVYHLYFLILCVPTLLTSALSRFG